MTSPNALILAGSGMLNGVAAHLAGDGWRVVLPSRRYTPLRADRPLPGKAIWVPADWGRPWDLARDVERVLTAPARLIVAWMHESYRRSVLGAVERLLADDAPAVEVRAVADLGPVPGETEPWFIGRPTQQVLVGTVCEEDSNRGLSHDEIVGGVVDAVDRALRGRPQSLHQVGKSTPVQGY